MYIIIKSLYVQIDDLKKKFLLGNKGWNQNITFVDFVWLLFHCRLLAEWMFNWTCFFTLSCRSITKNGWRRKYIFFAQFGLLLWFLWRNDSAWMLILNHFFIYSFFFLIYMARGYLGHDLILHFIPCQFDISHVETLPSLSCSQKCVG